MRLQKRLTLFFILIVVLPLAVAAVVLQRVVLQEVEERSIASINPALETAVVLYNDRVVVIDDQVKAVVVGRTKLATLLLRGKNASVAPYLEQLVARSDGAVDFLVVLDVRGRTIGSASVPGDFVDGFQEPPIATILDDEDGLGPGFSRTGRISITIPGEGPVGYVIGGFWVDKGMLTSAATGDIEVSLVAGGRVIASTADLTGPVEVDVSYSGNFDFDLDGDVEAGARGLAGEMAIVASTPTAPIGKLAGRINGMMVLLLAVVILLTGALAYLLARLLTQPLEELTEGARAILEGRFTHRIPVRSKDEVGELAVVFNDMTERLAVTIDELSTSRDQLQRAVRRVGETLRSTHDMKQILRSIIDMAADALRADVAVLWTMSPGRDELQAMRATGVDLSTLGRVKVGEGLAGFVAERGASVLLPDEGAPRPTTSEPQLPCAVAVPIYSQERLMGVMTVYRSSEEDPFSSGDLDTVAFLAQQGGVAVENVMLHEEAQRLSITDGLTGVWNRRYFTMQFKQVLATAQRFDRRFSILLLDLAHFQSVNDEHGHQRGDEVLIECAQRVRRVLREVDTFARYGGEEFICLLTETDPEGAVTTAEKILDALRGEPFQVAGGLTLEITVSIGAAAFPDHGRTLTGLVEAADQALYRAKNEGRDRVVVAGSSPPPGLRIAK